MIPLRRRSIVLLGMMTKMPVPGVIWQTLHYLLGFRRLGYDVVYVEAHARAPIPFMDNPTDPGTARAAAFLHELMSRFDLGGRWAYHALHEGGECLGMGQAALQRAYESASAIVNLHGGTVPRDEHIATGRLVLLSTDPGLLEIELASGRPETVRLVEAHYAAFTFGENYGRMVGGLPVSDRFLLLPTRQPVVPELWEHDAPAGPLYRTVANWRQRGREFGFGGEWYEWSKDLEFAKILDAPERSGLGFELALSNITAGDRTLLESRGWLVRDAGSFGTSIDSYRRFIQESRGELTAAKDQNVRLRTGWFSDRSATFLAAGRPVVTQDTGFAENLPTGRGLFAYTDLESALAALEFIESDHGAACRAASEIAREYFDYRVVLTRLLADAGVEGPRAPAAPRAQVLPLSSDLLLEPVARRPLQLADETVRALDARPLPEAADTGASPFTFPSPFPFPFTFTYASPFTYPSPFTYASPFTYPSPFPSPSPCSFAGPCKRIGGGAGEGAGEGAGAGAGEGEGAGVGEGGGVGEGEGGGEWGGHVSAACASVIVVTWDNLALTRLCLESLLAHTHDVCFELIVVDNASTDGTRAYLEALAAAEPRVRLILNERNDGFARACNQGARAAVGDILVFLNNDTVLAPGWLGGLCAHLQHADVGAVNAVTNRIGTEAEVSERARTLGEYLERAALRRVVHAGEARCVEMLAFFCLALRRDVWTRVGPLDEAFGRGLFEDDDYSVRLRAAGYRLVCAEDVLVYHLGGASFGRLVPDGTYGKLFDENRRRFESKWGHEWRRPARSADVRYDVLIKRIRATVAAYAPAGATVAVVSRGDNALLELGDATAWHFPLASDGSWAGHYPANTAAAVAQVEAVRLAGAEYLLLPEPAFWWLDHYPGLGDHLLRYGQEVARTSDLRLYRLLGTQLPLEDPPHMAPSMESAI